MRLGSKLIVLAVSAICVPLASIFVAIYLSPWFRWERNALSDLGHAVKSEVAPIFNLGLVTGGLLFLMFSVLYMHRRYPLTSKLMVLASYFLILIGTFDEIYGPLHFLVSLVFFIALAFAALAYSYESRKSYPVAITMIIGISWALQLSGICECGASVPEMISVLASLVWFTDALRGIRRSIAWS
ncbi:MAG: DUF998 domain-containing protein [Candidatus Korarchaeum sp.]|nr:DUF998 domain-containing protein [Candidatus Korarchaeum sp.]MDW8035964.1 DUF998 domain-containing protein [Candidatus Korarchaeum sp.]